jgi:hypothetical protein
MTVTERYQGARGGAEAENKARFRRTVLGWHTQHPRSFPWRESRDPYALLGHKLSDDRAVAEANSKTRQAAA